jgi:pectate lyase
MSDLLRLTGSSDFVTVSWSEFRHTVFGMEHMGVNIGFTDDEPDAVGHLNVTLHHNFYSERINERMPRVRFGKVHTFNNLVLAGTSDVAYYAVRAGVDANVRSERNIYQGFTGTSWFEDADSSVFNYGFGNANSVLQSIEDSFVNCADRTTDNDGVEGGTFSKGTAFVPPYPYTAEPTANLEATIRAGVGPQ